MRDAHLYQRNTRGDPVSPQSNPTMRLGYDRISLRADQPIGMINPTDREPGESRILGDRDPWLSTELTNQSPRRLAQLCPQKTPTPKSERWSSEAVGGVTTIPTNG